MVRGNYVTLTTAVRPTSLLWLLQFIQKQDGRLRLNLNMLKFINLLLGDFKHLRHVVWHFRGGLSAIKQHAYNFFLLSRKCYRNINIEYPPNIENNLSVVAMTINHCLTNARQIRYKRSVASGTRLWLVIELAHAVLTDNQVFSMKYLISSRTIRHSKTGSNANN